MSKLSKNIGFIAFPRLGIVSPHDAPMPSLRADIPDRYKVLGIDKKVIPAAAMQSNVNNNPDEGVPLDQRVNSGFINTDYEKNKNPLTYNANVSHEKQHSIFNQLKQEYGTGLAQRAIEHVLGVLTPTEHKLIHFVNIDKKRYPEASRDEEALAHVHNFLQDPDYRERLKTKLDLDEKQAKRLHDHIKEAWHKMCKAGSTFSVDLNKSETLAKTEEKNLFVHHNLTERNLHHAAQNGLIAPSLAISNKNHPMHNFGEITLVADKDMVDPKKGAAVFDADVYSPRYPQARYKVDHKKLQALGDSLAPHFNRTGQHHDLEDSVTKDSAEDMAFGRGWQDAYLASKGHIVPQALKERERAFPWARQPSFQKYLASKGGVLSHNYGLGDEEHKRLSSAVNDAIEEHRKERIAAVEPEYHDMINEDSQYAKESALDENGLFRDHKFYKLKSDVDAPDRVPDFQQTVKDIDSTLPQVDPNWKQNLPRWIESKLEGVRHSPYFTKQGSTGNVRKVPMTPENILKEMTKDIRGGEGFGFGLGEHRAQGAKRFSSLEQIGQHRDRIVPSEEFEGHKNALNDEFFSLLNGLETKHQRSADDLATAIGESYKKGHSLYNELKLSGFSVTPEQYKAIADFAHKLKTAPTEYFEAKPKRIVKLNEFKGAAVPHNVTQRTLEVLKEKGIHHIEQYESGNDEDRKRAVQKIAEHHNLALSESENYERLSKRDVPVFPKLGVVDRSRPENIDPKVEPTRFANKLRYMAHNDARAIYSNKFTTDPKTNQTVPLKPSPETVAHWQNKAKQTAKDEAVNPSFRGVQSGPHALVVSATPFPDAEIGTALHEGLHAQFAKIASKHGRKAREHFVENLYHALPDAQRAILASMFEVRKRHYRPSKWKEETLAGLMSYVNDPAHRDEQHQIWRFENGQEDENEVVHIKIPGTKGPRKDGTWSIEHLSAELKQAHRNLLAASEVADKNWLKQGHIKDVFTYAAFKKSDNDMIIPAMSMLGHSKTVLVLTKAAEFLSGKKVAPELVEIYLKEFEGDVHKAILKAHDLDINAKNIKALHDIVKIKSLKKGILESKYKVRAYSEHSKELADELQRQFDMNDFEEIDLIGKHSRGAIVVGSPPDDYLIKPGSGKESPAAGAGDSSSGQSEREVAFYHIANAIGLGHVVPAAELVGINDIPCAAIKMLPSTYRNLAGNDSDINASRKVLDKYRISGEIYQWAIMDFILGQTDRHGQNMMVGPEDEGAHVKLIDHGSAFAGDGFSPGKDKNSFIPYYLRVWTHDWHNLSQEKKIQSMPMLSSDREAYVRNWANSIDPNNIKILCNRYGVDYRPVFKRLDLVRKSEGPISKVMAKLWVST